MSFSFFFGLYTLAGDRDGEVKKDDCIDCSSLFIGDDYSGRFLIYSSLISLVVSTNNGFESGLAGTWIGLIVYSFEFKQPIFKN